MVGRDVSSILISYCVNRDLPFSSMYNDQMDFHEYFYLSLCLYKNPSISIFLATRIFSIDWRDSQLRNLPYFHFQCIMYSIQSFFMLVLCLYVDEHRSLLDLWVFRFMLYWFWKRACGTLNYWVKITLDNKINLSKDYIT